MARAQPILRAVAISVGVVAACAFAQGPAPDAARIFDRVVCVGASLSDGFGNNLPPSLLLEQAIQGPHQPVDRVTSALFFVAPEIEGKRQIDTALNRKPTLLVGLDFLFWYAYGFLVGNPDSVSTEERPEGTEEEIEWRSKLLENGFAQLERIQAPIVVGDLPDMWGADPEMIHPRQIPSVKALERMNERIRAWAKARKRVLLLPLSEWAKETKEGKAHLPGRPNETIPAEELLQADRLHPSEAGAVLLFDRIIEAMRAWLGKEVAARLRFDVGAVLLDRGIELELAASVKKDG